MLESRAWLALWSLCPPYAVYFAFRMGFPDRLTTMWERIFCLAAAACVHAALFAAGTMWLRLRRRGEEEGLLSDERDQAIDARATQGAYYVLLLGAVAAGMILPFKETGWAIVNASLLFILLSEVLRNWLIVRAYRGPRLAR
ncbi:MAG TPA: hypothetical protein VFW19_16055 [Allosphingosinicella sp.]|nr:hypothetical protein [Allosphingosinicella sp.]